MIDHTFDTAGPDFCHHTSQFFGGVTGRARIRCEDVHTDLTARKLSELAVSALIEEAELTPKPALVDCRGNGAHHDLDLARLRCSAYALQDGFTAMARAAMEERQAIRLREQLGRIGREMEHRMLAATGGSNAHRGAIWALGLLVAATARQGSNCKEYVLAKAAASLAQLPDKGAVNGRSVLSHGERAWLTYSAAGARGEAQDAFPHAIHVGLPVLRAARKQGLSEDCARLDALMAIMARLNDTCLLYRGGHTALAATKTGAHAVLLAGGTGTPAGRQRLNQLHHELMVRWVSPGGSADLLAVTLFLDRLGNRSHSTTQQQDGFYGNTKL